MIKPILGQLAQGTHLTKDQMVSAIDEIITGKCSDADIGLFLTGLRLKGETVLEIAGAASALRKHMVPIKTKHQVYVDVCGTGGDNIGTFNISTAAAFVTAAAGVPVAKHGNRRVSSKTGSADVLQALGVNVEADVRVSEACLDELGICFCFAPLFHPSMKQVAAVRKQLGVPTIFNLLGPLCNPAGAPYQVIGVNRPEVREKIADALNLLGSKRALVVYGEDGLDEITITGTTYITEINQGKKRELHWEPEDFGISKSEIEPLLVNNPEESARLIRSVMANEPGPAQDIVVMNAAAALWITGKANTPFAAGNLALEAIESGAAREIMEKLIVRSNKK